MLPVFGLAVKSLPIQIMLLHVYELAQFNGVILRGGHGVTPTYSRIFYQVLDVFREIPDTQN